MSRAFAFLLLALPPLAGSRLDAGEKFDLRDGDRVVWIGNTLVEREQRYGYWETLLTVRYPDRNITFRNLGWSGDTVWGEARAGFGTAEHGFKQLITGVKGLKPTVLFIAYGTNEAFEGEKGLPRFRAGLERLLDELASTKARVVLFSPLPMESLGPPLLDATEQNRNLELYTKEIGKVAEMRKHYFADLFTVVRKAKLDRPLTDNGLHLTESGYRKTAPLLVEALGLGENRQTVERSVVEKLREAIIEKNRLYFHRWRPQNETYLFGFRKHEQGQNAREIPLFDPLVEKQEIEIARIRKSLARQ
jgi:lysophospholipase L1-like esterase